MENQNFSSTIWVDHSPQEVFNAVNNVEAWWSKNVNGNTIALHDEFLLDFESHWWTFKIIEIVANKKVVWQVSGSYMPWNEDIYEWTDTTISFEISPDAAQTKLLFTHHGLVPQSSCFEDCLKGWSGYINISLKNLISTGIGKPNSF